MKGSRRAGALLVTIVAIATIVGPRLSQHEPSRQFADFEYAPPMPPRMIDADGDLRAPFVYPLRLADRLERRYEEDRTRPTPLRWFTAGAFVSIDEGAGPWLPLGADALGRDVFARLVRGARMSLGVAVLAAAGALLLGALIGGVAGFAGGTIDTAAMRLADFVVILPVIYVVLALRAVMPLVLSNTEVFWTIVVVMVSAGWPYPARGVRAVIAAERQKEYAEAARAMGAGRMRILLRHLLPATLGFLTVQATLLLPAFIVAEATLSFVSLGFSESTPSWGRMLEDAANPAALVDAPWLLAPVIAIVLTVFGFHLIAGRRNPVEDRGVRFL